MQSSVKAFRLLLNEGWLLSNIDAIWMPYPVVSVEVVSNDGGKVVLRGSRDLYNVATESIGED